MCVPRVCVCLHPPPTQLLTYPFGHWNIITSLFFPFLLLLLLLKREKIADRRRRGERARQRCASLKRRETYHICCERKENIFSTRAVNLFSTHGGSGTSCTHSLSTLIASAAAAAFLLKVKRKKKILIF